ncbi:phage regulatory CII family protein [Stenotrophomonas sp. NPDC078853]|uniref:phage regulatory CII family protein n=1 Tax=Stenotrophomonas sp. NPDC078853 TaxID=3364534 RepID=UPI0038509A7C
MTCRTTSLNWLDCLYNAVRKTPGGVNEAAQWLTDRRGKSIHPETLRAKLNGSEGESVTIEIAELLTEWIKKHAGGAEYALEWLQALAAQHGMAVDVVPPAPEGGWADEIGALQTKLLEITSRVGRLSGTAVHAMADQRIDSEEASLMVSEVRALRTMAHRLERNIARAVGKGRRR